MADLLVPLAAFDEALPPGLHGSALTGPAPMRCMIVDHDTDSSVVLLLAPEAVERVPTEEVFVDLSAPPTPDAWVDALPWALGVLARRGAEGRRAVANYDLARKKVGDDDVARGMVVDALRERVGLP